jgi:hypothetical protein
MTSIDSEPRQRSSALLGVLAGSATLLIAACGGAAGDSEPTEPTIPANPAAIVAQAAVAMGQTTSVQFELSSTGAPVFIDEFESIALTRAVGQFEVPSSAQAVLEVRVNDSLNTELGAIALDDEVWLSNPITGVFETLPPGYDLDPSLFFDPKNGWQPLMENLTDVEFLGVETRDGNDRYRISATAPAEQIEVITARLVRNQDVDINFWIQPVTGHVRAAEFTTATPSGDVNWTLELDDFGADFDIELPEGITR